MIEEVKTTEEASSSDAGTKPVENNEVDSTVAEILEKIPSILEENEKLKKDNENYKTGMLSYKKKLRDQGFDDEEEKPSLDADDIVSRVVEKITPLIQQQPKVDNENDSLKRKVSELTVALKNRSQVTVSAASSASASEEKKKEDNYFSEAQIADLKSRGLDPAKVKENILKYKQKSEV